jgi:hypothetical protein
VLVVRGQRRSKCIQQRPVIRGGCYVCIQNPFTWIYHIPCCWDAVLLFIEYPRACSHTLHARLFVSCWWCMCASLLHGSNTLSRLIWPFSGNFSLIESTFVLVKNARKVDHAFEMLLVGKHSQVSFRVMQCWHCKCCIAYSLWTIVIHLYMHACLHQQLYIEKISWLFGPDDC